MNLNKEINDENTLGKNGSIYNEEGIAEDGTKVYLGSGSLTWSANQRRMALQNNAVKPAMAYSQEEFIKNEKTGLWATEKTVQEQVEQRQDMPRG